MLTALVTLIIVMLLGVLGGNLIHPGSWHKSFRVLLGLDLSSGTAVTLKAVTPGNAAPSQSAMTTARTIMENRVNGAGFTGAQVQQQGSDIITVSVPGRSASQVVQLVGSTAQLRIRQVVLVASNYTSAAAPAPSATPPPPPPPPPPGPPPRALGDAHPHPISLTVGLDPDAHPLRLEEGQDHGLRQVQQAGEPEGERQPVRHA